MARQLTQYLMQRPFALLAMGISLTWWVLESLLHAHVYVSERAFSAAFFADQGPDEVLGRAIVVVTLLVLGVYADIHRRRCGVLKDRAQRTARLLSMLGEANRRMSRLESRQEVLAAICATVVDLGEVEMAWTGMRSTDGFRLASSSVQSERYASVIDSLRKSGRLDGSGDIQAVFVTGRMHHYDLDQAEHSLPPWQLEARNAGLKQLLVLPLKMNKRTEGVFSVYCKPQTSLDDEARSILLELAGNASLALTNLAHREQRRRESEELIARMNELERFQQATVNREFRIHELRREIARLKSGRTGVERDYG